MNKELVGNQESLDFLQRYLNANSPSGSEGEGQKVWIDYVSQYADKVETDVYGSAVAIINPDHPYKIMIEAHADEISWRVKYIDDNGYIYVHPNGGSDAEIAPSKRVNILTKKGSVKGVFGWPAIHVREKDAKKASDDNIIIDIGATTKDAVKTLGVDVGCLVMYEDEMTVLNDTFIMGRALDNKMGGFMIAEVLRKASTFKDRYPFGLYVVNAVQEEVGCYGAKMMAERINPNVAIVTDVCHDSNAPKYDKIKEADTSCGKGPVLTFGPTIHSNVLKMLLDIAEDLQIPIQRNVSNYHTGTDTDSIAYSGMGVPSALISLPLKYMHTTVEMAHKDDIENVIKLMFAFLNKFPENHDFKYIK